MSKTNHRVNPLSKERVEIMDMKLSRYELRGAVAGMILGDAYLYKPKVAPNVTVHFTHSPKQSAYGYWKLALLAQLTGKEGRVYEHLTKLSNGKAYAQVDFQSTSHPLLRRLRKVAYPAGIKTITPKLLSYLTPKGLAIWYMDDGSVNIDRRHGRLKGRQIFLHTCCPFDQAKLIIDYFKCTWDIDWKIVRSRKDVEYFTLHANVENAIKFFKIIAPFVHPQMRYKIDLQYHNNVGRTYRRVQERIAELKDSGLFFGSEDMIPTPAFSSLN